MARGHRGRGGGCGGGRGCGRFIHHVELGDPITGGETTARLEDIAGGPLAPSTLCVLTSFQLNKQWPDRGILVTNLNIVIRIATIEKIARAKKEIEILISNINLEYTGWFPYRGREEFEDFIQLSLERPVVG
ncbi:hypothetical protein PanWU01x14_298260 [Parasponia andersonii]|uniref:Uncharacterized protein n=1 Tax=Parasponia andersonii TaxID=3476 RepID=A0A2P5AUX1_PARAD|nr:hypothetical protein PanWU01x14_298260 [Parasponia andersonii]